MKEMTWKGFDSAISVLADKITKTKTIPFKNIYAIPRGGLVPAVALSHRLNIPLITDKKEITDDTLVVDDISDKGDTLLKLFSEVGNKKSASLCKRTDTKHEPDFYVFSEKSHWIEFPWEKNSNELSEPSIIKIEESVRSLLTAIGEDAEREGLLDTPKRVARFYTEWLEYEKQQKEYASFHANYNNMVIVKDIPFYSLCEHHMIPFFGKAHIGYIPSGSVLGLSKLVRILNKYARRLQIQERLTTEVVDEIVKKISPAGVMVVIEAEHLCMSMRGVRTPGSKTVTSEIRGQFNDISTRSEFQAFIK